MAEIKGLTRAEAQQACEEAWEVSDEQEARLAEAFHNVKGFNDRRQRAARKRRGDADGHEGWKRFMAYAGKSQGVSGGLERLKGIEAKEAAKRFVESMRG